MLVFQSQLLSMRGFSPPLNRMAKSSASSPGSHLLWKINSSDCCALEIMKTSSPLVFGKVLSHFLLM